MTRLRLALLAFALVLAAPAARAEPSTILTALGQLPAAADFHGTPMLFDVTDLKALRQAAGVPEGVRLADLRTLPEAEEERVTELLRRFISQAGFRNYLLIEGPPWVELVGFDLLEADWVTEAGAPPRRLLIFGGEALPAGEALTVLEASGLQPQERGGTTVWARGEDYRHDLTRREPAFPFWGELGMSVRIFRGEQALVGARAWRDLNLALAVERGAANSLADLPRYRLAVAAAGDPGLSGGPVLQMAFLDLLAGGQPLGQAEQGPPPYDLFAFADRQDDSGQQVILVLTYAERAAAEEAAELLAAALPSHRDRGGSLVGSFPGLEVTASVLETADGAAAVLRLATPPEPAREADGKVRNRSRLYEQVYRMLMMRDLAVLAPRG